MVDFEARDGVSLHLNKILLLKLIQFFFKCKQLPVPKDINSILIIRQHDQLGDFLMSTPVFREIKKVLPGCKLSVVLTPYTKPVAEHNPHLDEFIVYQPKALKWKLSDLFCFVKQIRKRYDLAMVLNTPSRSLTSDLIAFFSRARFRLGMEPRSEGDPAKYDFLYHATAPRPHPRINQTLENLSILQALGIYYQNTCEEMFLTDEEKQWAKNQLNTINIMAKPIILLPGAGKHENRWPSKHFIELGKKISHVAPILVLWGPGQEEAGEKVLTGLVNHNAKTIRNTGIRQMAALISLSCLVTCNDTGDLHISAAVGASTLGLFGPTDPNTYLPQGEHVKFLQSKTGKMEDLLVDTVFNKALRIIGDTRHQS